jgi:Trk K+ transport system NAD-binding subunit
MLGDRSRVMWLYARALVREFRWTILGATGAVVSGALVIALSTPRPPLPQAVLAAWMAMFAESVLAPPESWHLTILYCVYPLVGVVIVGEGIIRLALLMASRTRGEKEWMRVMAQTMRDHVIVCGLGHLGYRVFGELLGRGEKVVAIELDSGCRFLAQAKGRGMPVFVRDMKDDQVLLEAGIEHARTIVLATNDDMANLEAALDARRMNPRIRVILRLFDQQIAAKVADAFAIDQAFSSSALAAPTVAAMAQGGRVKASYDIAGVTHVTVEIDVAPSSHFAGRRVGDLEDAEAIKVLARGGKPARSEEIIAAGDRLTLHARADQADRLG